MLLRFRHRARCPGALSLLALIVAGAGCDPRTVATDAPRADAGPPALTLRAVEVGPIGLPFGSTTEISVELLDGLGAPRSGETVTFALEGTAADSSLDELDATTDARGRASVNLRAGESPSSFRVRANHALASPIWIDVTVAASFGSLRARPIYEGPRAVESWSVALFRGGDCAAALAMPTAGAAREIRSASGEAHFLALSTDVSYTVVVRGTSTLSGDRVTATGCTMGVGILPDRETTLDVVATSTGLDVTGDYEVVVTMDASLAVDEPLRAFTAAALLRAGGPADDAERLLAALEAELAGDLDGLAAVSRLRAGGASEALASSLSLSAPTEALDGLLDVASTALYDLRAEASLTVGDGDVPTLTVRRVVAASGSGAPLPLSIEPTSPEPVVLAVTFAAEGDTLLVDRLSVPLPLGQALAAVLRAQRDAAGFGSSGELFGLAACGALETFVYGDAALAASCDADCVARTCTAALEATWAVALAEPETLDAERQRIELSGTVEIGDGDGDLRADTLHGALSGTFEGESASEAPVSAELSAARPLG